jgi:hypothetical protein
MSDDGSRTIVKGLKHEWALFWESITGDPHAEDAFETGKLEVLNADQLHDITKALSQDRKRIHQKLESLHKELELNSVKLESLRLVGSEAEGTLKRITELNDIGQYLSEQLHKLDEKMKWAHSKQEQIFATR